MLNNYNEIAGEYVKTNEKPDKKYSIIPTVIDLCGDVSGKVVLELGCGDGVILEKFSASQPKELIGIDNSEKQIERAKLRFAGKQGNFELRDIFADEIPQADIIIGAFVFNYAQDLAELKSLVSKIKETLDSEGFCVGVVDLPNPGNDLSKFGAVKKINRLKDEEPIVLDLYDKEELVCTLNSFYYKKETIEKAFKEVGMTIEWYQPIISQEGIEKFGQEFWGGYIESPELGYFIAKR